MSFGQVPVYILGDVLVRHLYVEAGVNLRDYLRLSELNKYFYSLMSSNEFYQMVLLAISKHGNHRLIQTSTSSDPKSVIRDICKVSKGLLSGKDYSSYPQIISANSKSTPNLAGSFHMRIPLEIPKALQYKFYSLVQADNYWSISVDFKLPIGTLNLTDRESLILITLACGKDDRWSLGVTNGVLFVCKDRLSDKLHIEENKWYTFIYQKYPLTMQKKCNIYLTELGSGVVKKAKTVDFNHSSGVLRIGIGFLRNTTSFFAKQVVMTKDNNNWSKSDRLYLSNFIVNNYSPTSTHPAIKRLFPTKKAPFKIAEYNSVLSTEGPVKLNKNSFQHFFGPNVK